MEHRKDILWRTYLVYLFMVIFAFAILYRVIHLQFIEGETWRQKAKEQNTRYVDVEATRGNIFDVNGNLLATSLPYYEVGMDINAPSIHKDTLAKYLDPLCTQLSDLFGDKTAKEYKSLLKKARKEKDRYVLIKRNVSYRDLQLLKKFPIFNKGKRGGLVYLQTNKRERPFKMLASRTIGYTRDNLKVGIEGAYDSILRGISGKRLMQKIAADVWRPINDENEIEPQNGSDVYTTIDINIQDVAENALFKALVKNDASHGCAVLMEVKTGEVKAIVNLTRTDSGMYSEQLNYAIGFPTEPGSTFKLASIIAAMDDGYVKITDKFNVGNGTCQYYDREVKDSHEPPSAILTVKEIFEISSNVGVSKIITNYYNKNPQQYISKIKTFHMDQMLGLGIPGEGRPLIKNVKDKDWSGTTLPWMSFGYECLITPMQTLTLYNAVANNGKMVKPKFINLIKNKGNIVKKIDTEILNEKIAKPEVIAQAKTLLEGVVEKGTGKGLNINAFKVAGKTGTAQIAQNGTYSKNGQKIYQASFVGYFPAENPLYTCIVIINSPSNGIYYGGLVAGPVFKEIAEKVYSGSLDFHKEINSGTKIITAAPVLAKTKRTDAVLAMKKLGLNYKDESNTKEEQTYITQVSDSTKIRISDNNVENVLKKGLVPNLNGLTAKDALYLLENNGLRVKLKGIGVVKQQSIEAGYKFLKGEEIVLTLN